MRYKRWIQLRGALRCATTFSNKHIERHPSLICNGSYRPLPAVSVTSIWTVFSLHIIIVCRYREAVQSLSSLSWGLSTSVTHLFASPSPHVFPLQSVKIAQSPKIWMDLFQRPAVGTLIGPIPLMFRKLLARIFARYIARSSRS